MKIKDLEKVANKDNFTLHVLMGKNKLLINIIKGSPEKLSQKEIDTGYIDCLYYSVFNDLDKLLSKINGGILALKTYYDDMTIEEIIETTFKAISIDLDLPMKALYQY